MSFYYHQKDLAKALKLRVDQIDNIINIFDSNPDDEWEIIKGKDYIFQGGQRFFSEEGAFAIADYVEKVHIPKNPKPIWESMWDNFHDWMTNYKTKMKQQFAIQKLKESLQEREINDLLIPKYNTHFMSTDNVVKVLSTNHAKLYQVFRQLKRTEQPLILEKHYFEDPDQGEPPRNRYYSCLGIIKITEYLGDKDTGLKQKNRRDWCQLVGEIIEPTVQKLLKEGTSQDNKIKKAMETARDMYNNQCQITGKKSTRHNNTTIEVHHIYDKKTYPHLADCVDNLITLDDQVHTAFHAWNTAQNREKGKTNPESCTIDHLLTFAIEKYPDRVKSIDQLSNIKSKLSKVYNLNSLGNSNGEDADTPERIITTSEELASFYLIKTLLRDMIDVNRIQYKDTQGYFGINLDGRGARTICRLYLGRFRKYINILEVEGQGHRIDLSTLDDIYGLDTLLKERVKYLTRENKESTTH